MEPSLPIPGRWKTLLDRIGSADQWAWPLAVAAVLIYLVCFGSFIDRHASLPFWDGYVYVLKTSNLAEKFERASLVERLNPALYLKEVQPERPPLLLAIAAILLGPDPGNAAIAYVWLVIRVAVILLALYLLSREFCTSRFVPAAALVIFGSPLMCNYYRLHFMDEPFGAFGLLVFTLLLIDDRRQTVWSASGASASILALFLVKPVAPAFVFPWCVIRGMRALLPLRDGWANFKPRIPGLILWVIPYLILLLVMLALLFASSYGPGIREQYKLGSSGYWHKDVSATEAFQLVSLVLPPWLLIAFLSTLPFVRNLRHEAVLLYLGAGLAWWLVFSFFLTYAVEDRLLGQAMPYVVTGLLVWICQRPALSSVVTVAAALFFICNTLVANGRMPRASASGVVRFLSPVPHVQKPVPEVGLLPFARQVHAAIKPEKQEMIHGVFSDPYVEPNSLNMALRINAQPQYLRVHRIPSDPARFDLSRFFRRRWFITKTERPNSGATGTGLWTAMNCVHALITNPESPLHSYFQKTVEAPIRQPDMEDTLVLWHLPSPPPPAAISGALRWLKPRLTNEPPVFSAAIDSQLRALD